VAGATNQRTAQELGISRRTVEVHRRRIQAKLNVRNTADLVRLVMS
jgi:two-component system response regulator DctR